ncbi:MAG TPA: hypothetical protein VN603_01960 [Candidatus Acidoferrales bacterium]|nr:hypothetical protein [Candidatus Acidoferrales bacterium]
MRRTPRIDLGTYLLAIPLLLRNPELMAVPLLSGIVGVALARFLSASADILGLGQLIQFLLDAFALAVSIILADMAWRRGRGSFDDAWTDARRKAGDILLTAIGLNFIIFVADFAGRFLGTYFEIGLDVIAIFFMIFALPAVAIGGIPGGAALQISIDRVRQAPVPAGILTVVFLVLYFGTLLGPFYLGLYGIVSLLGSAVLKAIVLGYLALVMAKIYTDAAFSRY